MKNDKSDAVIIPHTNAIRPTLDEHHKFARVPYAIENLNLDTEYYHDYFNAIHHVDEKWFSIGSAAVHVSCDW